MLTFIGLGLYDATDLSVKALECIRSARHVFLEQYTSRLMGTSVAELESLYDRKITLVRREEVEVDPEKILTCAAANETVFLTAGDAMVSTTHADLRIRAADRGIQTSIIHGSSIATAVCGVTGLQNYRFGKSCSVPFPEGKWFPKTPLMVIRENLSRDLHTLVYLDIKPDRFMTAGEAVSLLEDMAEQEETGISLYIGIARAGSRTPAVLAGSPAVLRRADLGGALHVLVVPAALHIVEREYLERFAGL
ncbi:MAG: diphthine synthase [Methanoregulaceae archaeon]|nr:diphthine synthase [Methanoregulaceae archaeon]